MPMIALADLDTCVRAGVPLTLTIQATAGFTPGAAINTAVFSSTQVLTRQATVLIYSSRVFLPIVLRGG